MGLVNHQAESEFMTTTEVARMLRVHRATPLRWIAAGKLEAVRIPGTRTIRVRVEAVTELIEHDESIEDLAGDLAEWLSHRGAEKAPSLCPRCAVRSVEKSSKQGWCTSCTTEVQIAEDEQRERERARKRRWWEENGSEWRKATRKGVVKGA